MKTLKTVDALTTRLLEIQRINSAAALLSWDQETYMPAGGGEARAEQISPVSGSTQVVSNCSTSGDTNFWCAMPWSVEICSARASPPPAGM